MPTDTPDADLHTNPTVDAVLTACQTDERREIIAYFESISSETATLTELVDIVHQCIPSSTRREVRAVLHHSHLPQLEAGGVLTYEAADSRVRYHGAPRVARLTQSDEF